VVEVVEVVAGLLALAAGLVDFVGLGLWPRQSALPLNMSVAPMINLFIR
jgi:hypothetical protein